MSKEETPFSKQLTVRALVIGALGSLAITTSSMYVALKLGALPWPIVFAAIISLVALKALGNTNLSEVNVAHTAMSAGAMVAGGVAFTIPGLWILDATASISWVQVLLAVASGVILGLIFSALIRKHYIDDRDLAYPMGQAAASTLVATDAGGKEAGILGASMGAAGIFTVLRDWFAAIPQMLFSKASLAGVSLAIYASPMMVAVGYMAGGIAVLVWIIGAVVGHFGIGVGTVAAGLFSAEEAQGFRSSLGIGLMVGSGVGVLFKTVIPHAKELFAPFFSSEARDESIVSMRWAPVALLVILAVMTWALGMGIVASVICILGAWIAVTMAAQSVGDTGIDPMEVFAVIVLLVARVVTGVAGAPAFLLTCVVAVACGLAGDVLSDFKAGRIIGTDPKAQWWGEVVGAAVGIVVSVGVLFLLVSAYGTSAFGDPAQFVAVQASVVASMVSGVPNPGALIGGVVIGAVLYAVGLPVMTLGLGVYLPFYLSFTASLGAVVRLVTEKIWPGSSQKTGLLVASGLLGGEAIVGVLIALIAVVGFFVSGGL